MTFDPNNVPDRFTDSEWRRAAALLSKMAARPDREFLIGEDWTVDDWTGADVLDRCRLCLHWQKKYTRRGRFYWVCELTPAGREAAASLRQHSAAA